MAERRRRAAVLSSAGRFVLLAAIALSVTALLVAHPIPLFGAALAWSLLAVSWPGRSVHERVEFMRLPPARLLEDEARLLELEFRLDARRSLLGVTLESHGPAVELFGTTPVLAPTPLGRLPVAVKARRRGRWQRIPVELRARGPFNLLPRIRAVEVPADLWVLPRPRALRERVLEEMLALRPRGLDLPQPTGPGEGEFYALRDWREGDPERRVHARLSARRGRKVIRVFRGEAPPLVDLVIDVRVAHAGRTFGSGDFDEAMRFAAGVVQSLLRRSVPVSLTLVGGSGPAPYVPSTCRNLDAYLGVLALAQPVQLKEAPGPPPLPAAHDRGRQVLLHLGPIAEEQLPPRWIVIQAGSKRYFHLLDWSREGGFAPSRTAPPPLAEARHAG